MQSKQALNDFPKISVNLRNSTLTAVKALHVVAYGDKGLPRQTRKNLRNFTNFAWDKESEEYSTKIDDVKNKLNENDDEDKDASDDDVDIDIYHKKNGKDVTEDEGDNEDNDINSDKDAYHEEEGKDVDVADDDNNADDMEDKMTTDLYTRNICLNF
uniref:Coiled-coil domain-containing protein 1-like n=1 Tax=Diabrotica virgifera virgifera TaxID=50390 RepID=A0A6P7GYD4_DIAVI